MLLTSIISAYKTFYIINYAKNIVIPANLCYALYRGVNMQKPFNYYIETDKFHLKYAKGESMIKGREYHDYNEIVFFISGKSFLISKDIQQELTQGSIIIIPKEQFHQFCISEPQTYVRCILGFRESDDICDLANEVMDTIKIISNPDERITSIFEKLTEFSMSDLTREEKELSVRSSLNLLLISLKLYPPKTILSNVNLSSTVSRALEIIDEDYTENLSVQNIADRLYVSPSTLAHNFRKEMNISLYQYITKKRLSVAHTLIGQGESLSVAALKSGFNDYSCFYRLYKKYYKQ